MATLRDIRRRIRTVQKTQQITRAMRMVAAAKLRRAQNAVLAARPVPSDAPRLPLAPGLKPVQQLDRTLCEIGERYGAARRDWVTLELEYGGSTDQISAPNPSSCSAKPSA